MGNAQAKRCGCCGIPKQLSEFSRNKGKRQGVNSLCKRCDVLKQKERREKQQRKLVLLVRAACEALMSEGASSLIPWKDIELYDKRGRIHTNTIMAALKRYPRADLEIVSMKSFYGIHYRRRASHG